MHKRKMRYVKKVFNGAWTTGLIHIGATVYFMERGIIPLWKCGNVKWRIAQRDPYPVILLTRLIDLNACFFGWCLLWMRGKVDAAPLLIIDPAMIGTDKRIVLYLAEREPGATMNAEIAPRQYLLTNTPVHDVLY